MPLVDKRRGLNMAVPREVLDCRIMEKYHWSYQELVETPKVMYDWVVELMEVDGDKARHDQASS
jgi:hypothetical protein